MRRSARATEVIESLLRAIFAEMRGRFVEDEPLPSLSAHARRDAPAVNVWSSRPTNLVN